MRACRRSTWGRMLRAEGLNAFHGRQPALFGLDFSVRPGEAVALLGRNGMGKTSTLKAVMGLIRVEASALRFGEVDLLKLPAHGRARAGLGYAPQDGRAFPALSVRENLRLGGGDDPERLEALLREFPQLRDRLGQRAGTLSGGEQQMLGIVRALWAEPRLLLLDEPSEGLMPSLVARLGEVLTRYRAGGGALLLAEQHVGWVRAWCDRLLILERGRLAFEGAPEALSPELERRHLGVA